MEYLKKHKQSYLLFSENLWPFCFFLMLDGNACPYSSLLTEKLGKQGKIMSMLKAILKKDQGRSIFRNSLDYVKCQGLALLEYIEIMTFQEFCKDL